MTQCLLLIISVSVSQAQEQTPCCWSLHQNQAGRPAAGFRSKRKIEKKVLKVGPGYAGPQTIHIRIIPYVHIALSTKSGKNFSYLKV